MLRWQELRDPHNPENRVAGGLSDLVKHSLYLLALEQTLPEHPQEIPATIYECHAGRGMYFIPRDDPRGALLAKLNRGVVNSTRQAVLARLGCSSEWYPGSAALIAQQLYMKSSHVQHQMLEWAPDTRAILRQVCRDLNHRGEIIQQDDETRFDGESYLARKVGTMTRSDLVLLDPFALFRQNKLHYRRKRYLQFFQGWLEQEENRPNVLWFFCAPATVDSIATNQQHTLEQHSYEDFRSLLATSACLEVSYFIEFPCELWFFANATQLDAIATSWAKEIEMLETSLGRDLKVRLVRRP